MRQVIWNLLSPINCVLCHQGGDWICERCRSRNRTETRWLEQVRVTGSRFDPKLVQAISLWKDGGCRDLTGPFARLIAARVKQIPAMVVAVPANRASLQRRGWWPTGELAKAVANELATPFASNAFSIQRVTRDQRGLSDGDRWLNVNSAFLAQSQLSDVLIVEDVITSGATVRSALKSLALSGGRGAQVSCVVFARSRFGFVQEV